MRARRIWVKRSGNSCDGNYAEVIKAAQKEVADNGYASDWRRLLVKSLLTVGRYGEAYTNAMAGLNDYSEHIEMRLLARETALYQNDLAGANQRLAEIGLFIQQDRPTAQDAEQLVALGQALLLLGVEPRVVLRKLFSTGGKIRSAAARGVFGHRPACLGQARFRAGRRRLPGGVEKILR